MERRHPKSIRREVLRILYQHYMDNPHEMLSPNDLLSHGTLEREDLLQNVFYLYDRKLVELMIGYNPPMFDAVRISADGIDLVENRFEFDLRFPPSHTDTDQSLGHIPTLMEDLVAEVDYCPCDGEERRRMLRDVQFLRDEFARPIDRWRRHVIHTVLDWLEAGIKNPGQHLPSAAKIRELVPLDRR